ncbi:MAG: hypothetical protein ACRDPH_02020 [Marmoricola sp.]
MSDVPRTLSRRATLGLAAAGLIAGGGCSVEVNNPYAGGASSPSPGSGGRSGRLAAADPDVRLAVAALTGIEQAIALVRRTGDRHPALATVYADTLAMHRHHAAALVEAVPSGLRPGHTRTVPVPRDGKAARKRLQAAEKELRHTLGGLAQRAHSGGFARLLASMAAAVHQREAVAGETHS